MAVFWDALEQHEDPEYNNPFPVYVKPWSDKYPEFVKHFNKNRKRRHDRFHEKRRISKSPGQLR